MAPAATPRGQRVAGWPTAGERAILAGWGVALNTYHRRRMIAAYRCISPWAVGFLVFVVGSLPASLFLGVSIGAPRECVNKAPPPEHEDVDVRMSGDVWSNRRHEVTLVRTVILPGGGTVTP